MKRSWLLALILLAVLLVGGIWYWTKVRTKPIKTTGEAIQALSETPLPGANVPSNPVEGKVPELNPLDKTNPFKDVYKNPFAP